MKWFKSFGDNEIIIDDKQFKILTKKLKLPKLSRAAGGHEFLDKTFGSNSDALNITKEGNNEYRVTARTDKVKAEVNKALGIKESTIQSFVNFNEEEKIFEEWLAEQTIDEVVSVSHRIKMKLAFKKNKAKIMLGRKQAETKPASPDQLKDRAKKQARSAFTKTILGGTDKGDLSLADKANVEKQLSKKKPAIAKLAKKLLPQIKAADKAKRSANKQESVVTEAMSDHDFVTDIVWDVKTKIDPDKNWDKFKAEVIKQAKKKKVKTDGYMIADILDESVTEAKTGLTEIDKSSRGSGAKNAILTVIDDLESAFFNLERYGKRDKQLKSELSDTMKDLKAAHKKLMNVQKELSERVVTEAFRIDNGTTVKMKDSKGKELYGKVVATLKVMGQAGVTVKWNDGTKGNFKNDQFASVSMDRKADYQISESVKTSQDLTEGMMGDTVTAVLGAIAGFAGGTTLGDKLKDYLSQQYRIKNLSMDQVNKIKSDGESWQVLKKGDKRVTNRMIKLLKKLDDALDTGADAKSVLAIMDEVTDRIRRDAQKSERIHYDKVREMASEILSAYYINKNVTDPDDPQSAAERKQQQKNYDALLRLRSEYSKEVYNRWNGQPHKNISKLEDKMLKHLKDNAKAENKAKAGSDKSLKIWIKKRADLIQKLEAEIKKYQGK